MTVGFERVVLVVVRTTTALGRLLDVVSLIESDHRIQVVFTTDTASTAVFRRGVEGSLAELDAAVISWEQAVATRFDLVIAASENDRLYQLDGPIVLLPHGFGFQKYYPNSQVVAGMDPTRLVHAGRVVPSVVAVAHPVQGAQLAVRCPRVAPRVVVIGDPALDRLLASRHRVAAYRASLGAAGPTLVLVASTWGPHSLWGRFPSLPERLVAALPVDEYRVAVVLHPGVWAAHGSWQVRGWLSRARESGAQLVAPDRWQAAAAAADCVVSDEGSLTLYAAALDKPLLIAAGEAAQTVVGSPLAALSGTAPRLDVHGELREQLDAGREAHRSGMWADIVSRGIDRQGQCAPILRDLLYRLLELPEPAEEAAFPPALAPTDQAAQPVVLVVGAPEHGSTVSLLRMPARLAGEPHESMDYRHLVVDLDQASVRQLGAASVLCLTGLPADARRFAHAADTLLARWPNASAVAGPVTPTSCLVRLRRDTVTARALDPPTGFDPLVLASLVFVRWRQDQPLRGPDQLRVGGRLIHVRLAAAS